MTTENIDYASYVDHTLLAMDATEMQIAKLCEEAQQHNFYAVCVNLATCRWWPSCCKKAR